MLARTRDVVCWIVLIAVVGVGVGVGGCLDDIIRQIESVQLAEEVESVVISEFEN